MKLDLTDSVFIDNHAHSLLKRHMEVDLFGFRRAFTESSSTSYIENHAANSIHYMNMLERLKSIIDFRDEDHFISLRQEFDSQDHVNQLWDDASIGALLIDDGFNEDALMPIDELSNLCERPIYRVLRIEHLLETLIKDCDSLAEITRQLEARIKSLRDYRAVGLKTIAAYRGGLPSSTFSDHALLRESFESTKKIIKATGTFRITKSPLYHHLLLNVFELAAMYEFPVQIHAGIGDSDLVLHESNPTIMTAIIKDRRFQNCQFVFLHCYPYHRETAYLCSVYPNVYMDLSLSVILVSAIAKNILLETIAQAPTSKLLAGSDGHSVPEMHWYGAVVFKRALESVLNQMILDSYISLDDAQKAAERILFGNCRELYQLDGLS